MIQKNYKHPNIILVFADQMRAQAAGFMGNEQVKTPNLDRLASEGIVFKNAYCSNPVCGPSRSSLLTGLYPHHTHVETNNVMLPYNILSIADIFKEKGYKTGYIGKWHLDGTGNPGFVPPGRRRHGFDFWAGFNRGHRYRPGQIQLLYLLQIMVNY